jgi:FkbM family methyltransferase
VITTVRDHTFFTNRLGPAAVVIDLGANHGDFTKKIVERFGAKCVAVEANRSLALGLAHELPGVSVKHAALTDYEGLVELQLTTNHETSSIVGVSPWDQRTTTESIDGITFDSLVAAESLQTIDLVKVDIEGAEVALFESTPSEVLERVAQFSVEFHDFTHVVSEQDVDRVIKRLRALGFSSIRFSTNNSNWLLVRRDRAGVSAVEFAFTKVALRHIRLVVRAYRWWRWWWATRRASASSASAIAPPS